MEYTNQVFSNKRVGWKCREHPQIPSDILLLNANDQQSVLLCFNCLKKNATLAQNSISMNQILAANSNEVIEGYPFLKDHQLSTRLLNIGQQSFDEIDSFFSKLRADFEVALRDAELRVKQGFIKFEANNKEVLEEYRKIAEVDKLKQLIVSDKQTAEEDLERFIKEKFNNAEGFIQKIQNIFNSQQTSWKLSLDKPKIMAQEIIEKIKNINFFDLSTTTSNGFPAQTSNNLPPVSFNPFGSFQFPPNNNPTAPSFGFKAQASNNFPATSSNLFGSFQFPPNNNPTAPSFGFKAQASNNFPAASSNPFSSFTFPPNNNPTAPSLDFTGKTSNNLPTNFPF